MQQTDSVNVIRFAGNSSRNVSWPALEKTEIPFKLFADTAVITWPLGSSEVSDVLHRSGNANPALLTSEETVFLKYHVGMTVVMENEGTHCYEDNTPAECRGDCVVGKIVEICGCIPFTFRKHVEVSVALPYCDTKLYANCSLNRSETIEECEHECRNPCEYTSYNWHVSSDLFYPGGERRFKILATPIHAPFVQFTVTKRQSRQEFFASIAAVINLYCGISGPGVIAAVIWGINFVIRYRERREADSIDHENRKEKTDILESEMNELKAKIAEITNRKQDASDRENAKAETDLLKVEVNELKAQITNQKHILTLEMNELKAKIAEITNQKRRQSPD